MAIVYAEKEEREWFREAWLASQIAPAIGAALAGKRDRTPHERLGWEPPVSKEESVMTPERFGNFYRDLWETHGARDERGH